MRCATDADLEATNDDDAAVLSASSAQWQLL
jgi:hypothetical protein